MSNEKRRAALAHLAALVSVLAPRRTSAEVIAEDRILLLSQRDKSEFETMRDIAGGYMPLLIDRHPLVARHASEAPTYVAAPAYAAPKPRFCRRCGGNPVLEKSDRDACRCSQPKGRAS